MRTESIRVTGTVQGVGFRPTVWRLASECGVVGSVRNDANGVLIEAWGEDAALNALIERIEADRPPLSIIDGIQRTAVSLDGPAPSSFTIEASASGRSATNVAADAATCSACLEDISDPGNRRYRYPFTNCTHCGPRLSIVHTIPYDRSNTSMAAFEMCDACRAEYEDPADRRFHAQPNACPDCGPSVWIEVPEGSGVETRGGDAIIEVARQLKAGRVVAIKGIGGFHLACLATHSEAVDLLRQRKRRYQKALALMARDVDVVRRFATVSEDDEVVLRSTSAPIVVLQAAGETLPEGVSPGQDTLGFMLPYTPLHHLLLAEFDVPLVMTSGNRSDEPQVIDNDDAREKLTGIADLFLMHDRDIVNRLDDSVVQSARSAPQVLRRARGHAPEPLKLHPSFADAPNVLALGGELKNTFCLLSSGTAIVSQHIGDMEEASAVLDYLGNIELYQNLYDFDAGAIAVDRHPDYVPNKLAAEHFPALPRIETQHHHAHVAACMAEHGFALNTEPVLGVVLDGLGLGDDGTFWGGELLVADFAGYERAGRFLPVVMPGGSRAMKEPWRNAWAHLDAAFGLGVRRETVQRPWGDPRAARQTCRLARSDAPSGHQFTVGLLGGSPVRCRCGRPRDLRRWHRARSAGRHGTGVPCCFGDGIGTRERLCARRGRWRLSDHQLAVALVRNTGRPSRRCFARLDRSAVSHRSRDRARSHRIGDSTTARAHHNRAQRGRVSEPTAPRDRV